MKIILMGRVSNLGMIGDIVEVATGYARNYLLPKGLAIAASKSNLQRVQNEKKRLDVLRKKDEEKSKSIADKLKEIECIIEMRVGDTGKLFGSVTSGTIANELKKAGFDIDKKMIVLKTPLKELGSYSVPVKFHAGVEQEVVVKVISKGKSIETQLQGAAEEEQLAEEDIVTADIETPEAGEQAAPEAPEAISAAEGADIEK